MAHPRLLVVNGDSNTFGAELADPASTSWAAIVGSALGIPVANLAAPGGSNRRMLRTTVEWLPGVCERRGLAPDQVLYIGMWTFLNRMEYWDTEPGRFPTAAGLTDGHWKAIGPWRVRKGHVQSVAWYRDLQDPAADVEEFFCSTVLLEHWLREFGCRFALTAAFEIVTHPMLEDNRPYVTQMKDEHYVHGVRGLVDAPFRKLVAPLRDIGKGGHALERSHRGYADDHLLPWLRTNTLLGCTP